MLAANGAIGHIADAGPRLDRGPSLGGLGGEGAEKASRARAKSVDDAGTGGATGVAMTAPQMSDIEQQWAQVRALLRVELGDTAFSTWVKPLDLGTVDGERVTIVVPTQFLREWVGTHYAAESRAIWNRINPRIRHVLLSVRAAGATQARAGEPTGADCAPSPVATFTPPPDCRRGGRQRAGGAGGADFVTPTRSMAIAANLACKRMPAA